jgi:hypothetical protein
MNDIRISTGASSYFSRPSHTLDYHLFSSDERILPDVRQNLLGLLLDYLRSRYSEPELWTMAWLAGSGISYQWSASRGNGDLDVLFGIDYSEFVNRNPDLRYYDRHELAELITHDLKINLWPITADTYFNGQSYEVTYFLNDNVEAYPDSIVHIHPYAAYNLTKDEWTVHPPKLPGDPHALYPSEYYSQAQANKDAAQALWDRYNVLRSERAFITPGTPQEVNNKRHMELVVNQARNLFDALHLGRRNAFSDQGEGYGDFYNFQWQSAKESGIINALNSMINKES